MNHYFSEDIEKSIKKYRDYMILYRNEMDICIQNWELYEEFQKNKDLFNKILPKTTAIHSFNTIQYSLVQVTWLGLMKLWDDDNVYNNNVRFRLLYTFINSKIYLDFMRNRYEYYPDSIVNFNKNKKEFKRLYNKYFNKKYNHIYKELKDIRNKMLAHADMDNRPTYTHSMDELREFYADSIRMIETAYALFNIGINLEERRTIVRRNANRFVAVINKLVTSSEP